jgi:hypothetical protein
LRAIDKARRFKVDDISISPSPMTKRPRLFRPGTLFDSKQYAKVFSVANHSPDVTAHTDEDEDPSEGEDQCAVERTSGEQPNLQDIFSQRREREM